jgi:hypothetical protein
VGCGEIRRLGVEKAYLRQRRKGAKKLMPKDFAGRRSATLQIRTLRSDGRGSAVVGAAVVCFIFKGHSHAPIYEGIVAGRISGCLARDAREGVGSIQIQSVLGRTWPAKGQIGGPDWPNRRYRAAKQFGRGRHQHEKPSGDLLRP